MEARIILSNADFSANNIGKFTTLSELTKKVLAKQTQYSEDSDEAQALNTFLAALTTGGFIGGESPLLKALFIPALASQHSEFFYNIASLDENGYPVNAMPAAERTAVTKVYSAITDSSSRIVGVKDVRGSLSVDDFNAQTLFDNGYGLTDDNLVIPNVSIALYNLYDKSQISYNDPMVALFSGVAYITSAQMGATRQAVNYGYDMTGTRLGFLGLTLDNENHLFNAAADNAILTPREGTPSSITTTSNTKAVARIGYTPIAESRHANVSFVAWGTDIFSEEMASLKSLVDTLMTALHAKSYITQ